MTLKRKNNHSNEISVFKLGENEVLHKILGLFCRKFTFQYMANGSHLGFDPWMTLNCQHNHTNGISAFKLVKNQVLHETIRLLCQNIKIQDGRRQPSWFLPLDDLKS